MVAALSDASFCCGFGRGLADCVNGLLVLFVLLWLGVWCCCLLVPVDVVSLCSGVGWFGGCVCGGFAELVITGLFIWF